MLQLVNTTPFAAERGVLLNGKAEQLWVVLIKGTFEYALNGHMDLAATQEPVAQSPSYIGEIGASTLLRDPEMVMDHPGTAVTLYGTATAPDGKPRPTFDVGLSINAVQRRVRVFGNRYWKRGWRGLRPSAPQPMTEMPLRYERAYGGFHATTGEQYPENPIGVGFYTRRAEAIEQALPNLEDPQSLLTRWDQRPAPACLAAIPSSWSPRRERAGTADERWQRERAPLWPEDLQPIYFNAAPAAQQVGTRLRGGEQVQLENIGGHPRVQFALPRVMFDVRAKLASGQLAMSVNLDRVIIEADRRQVIMVWRSTLNCGPDARRVLSTFIDTKLNIRTGRDDGTY